MPICEHGVHSALDYRRCADCIEALLTAERDAARAEIEALKAGKWAGPWQQVYTHAPATEKWERRHPRGHGVAELTAPSLILAPWSVSWRVVHAESGEAHSVEEAKAAADAALRAAGWFLADDHALQVTTGGQKP